MNAVFFYSVSKIAWLYIGLNRNLSSNSFLIQNSKIFHLIFFFIQNSKFSSKFCTIHKNSNIQLDIQLIMKRIYKNRKNCKNKKIKKSLQNFKTNTIGIEIILQQGSKNLPKV